MKGVVNGGGRKNNSGNRRNNDFVLDQGASDVMVNEVGQPEEEKGSDRNDKPEFHEVPPTATT